MIGYCAVTGGEQRRGDPVGYFRPLANAALLRHRHFRFKDYQAANIPVLPVVKVSVAKTTSRCGRVFVLPFAKTLMLTLTVMPVTIHGGRRGSRRLVARHVALRDYKSGR